MILYVLGIFIIILFLYSIIGNSNTLLLNTSVIENLENNDNDAKVLVYKNAGIIQNLQSSVDKLMSQVNKIVSKNTKQDMDIQSLKVNQGKIDAMAKQADSLSKKNKDRFLQLAQNSKQKSDKAQQDIQNMPSIQ